jgi:hypothetical protein
MALALKADHFRNGSWLRDNALTQPATVHDPVNVVRHGRSEQFFPVGRSGTASESSWGVLGKVNSRRRILAPKRLTKHRIGLTEYFRWARPHVSVGSIASL